MTSAPPSTKTLTATEIASMLGGTLCGASDAKFGQVQDIKTAQANEVAFFKSTPNEMGQHPSEDDFQAMRDSAAGLLLVDANCPEPKHCHIQVDNPSLAATIMAQFWQSRRAYCKPGIHPTAVIEDGAQVAASAYIGPNCVIGKNSTVGADCILHANVVLYDNVHLGDACVIQSNTTLGADGFGYTWDGTQHLHMPQIGGVRIGRGVARGRGRRAQRLAPARRRRRAERALARRHPAAGGDAAQARRERGGVEAALGDGGEGADGGGRAVQTRAARQGPRRGGVRGRRHPRRRQRARALGARAAAGGLRRAGDGGAAAARGGEPAGGVAGAAEPAVLRAAARAAGQL